MPPRPTRPMMRYRSPRIVPGENPPPSSEGEEASRPTGLSEGDRLAAAATDGVASPVGIWDRDPVGAPHAGQKRLASGNSAEHDGQRMGFPRDWAHATAGGVLYESPGPGIFREARDAERDGRAADGVRHGGRASDRRGHSAHDESSAAAQLGIL